MAENVEDRHRIRKPLSTYTLFGGSSLLHLSLDGGPSSKRRNCSTIETSMTSSVFFDLDGTLTDPKIGITASVQYALERLGLEAPEQDALLWCIGPPLHESLRSLASWRCALGGSARLL